MPMPPTLPPSSAPCLFLCSVKQTWCQGAPHEFPAPGSDPILLGRLRQCEFFRRLKLSGGQEFTFGAVNVGQGHLRKHTYTPIICSPQLEGRLGYLVGIAFFPIDLVTSVYASRVLFPVEIQLYCICSSTGHNCAMVRNNKMESYRLKLKPTLK